MAEPWRGAYCYEVVKTANDVFVTMQPADHAPWIYYVDYRDLHDKYTELLKDYNSLKEQING